MVESAALKERRYKRNIIIINLVTGAVVLYISIDFGITASLTCFEGNDSLGHLSLVFTVLFGVLGVVFFVSGVLMATSLKTYYPKFY